MLLNKSILFFSLEILKDESLGYTFSFVKEQREKH